MTEAQYQAKLVKRIEAMFPGCQIFLTGSSGRQGIPDLIILWYDCWAALEVKMSPESTVQPNQTYYVEHLNHMSFAAFIFPENEEDVLSALQQTFESSRRACVSQS